MNILKSNSMFALELQEGKIGEGGEKRLINLFSLVWKKKKRKERGNLSLPFISFNSIFVPIRIEEEWREGEEK